MKLTREEWLERRRSYLGASDAAAALGMSPWSSPADVARDKWGEKIEDEKANEALERGQILEALVAVIYARRTQHVIADGAFIVSRDWPWMAATPDRVDVSTNSLIQIKTSLMFTAHKWEMDGVDTIPPEYRIQGQHEMAVAGAKRNVFAVLFADASTFRSLCWAVARAPGEDHPAERRAALEAIAEHVDQLEGADDPPCRFATYPLERDDETIAMLVEQERIFWETYVVTHTLPPDKYTPEASPTILEATDEQREWMERARVHHIAKKEHETEYDECKEVLAVAIGDATGIHSEGIGTITYKAPKNISPVTNWLAVLEAVKAFVPADRLEAAMAENTAKPEKARVFLPKWDGVKRTRKAK